jgi:4-hydroxybenzoate polyprenyltransferase
VAIHFWIAGSIGLYIVGVTWFARTEATESNRLQLALATLIMLLGIGLLARYPYQAEDLLVLPERWVMFWAVLGLLVGWRNVRAIADPQPGNVQSAVKNAIMSLIVLDAAAVLPAGDIFWGLAILALLVPSMILGYWVYST